MSRRTALATATPPPINPLTESSRDIWQRWGVDQQQRELDARVEQEAHNQALTGPIYPREIGEAIAHETAKMIPDWRLLVEEHPVWIRKLVAQQPEMRVREVKQAQNLARLIGDSLPGHIRPLLADLQTIMELQTVAREAAAFLIGCEVGRVQQQMHWSRKGRLVKRREPAPESQALRLHLCAEVER